MNLTNSQKEALVLLNGKDNIFLTGAAGSGKSFTINHYLDNNYVDKIAVLAPTGVAAMIINGRTLHSFFGIGICKGSRSHIISKALSNLYVQKRVKEIDTIVLDEISMVSGYVLSIIEEITRKISKNDKVWGGKRIIVVGDFCLKLGTEVIMADGSLKKIEDISIGDKVMGQDSTPRIVKKLYIGKTLLYKVSQTNGDDYYTTGNHNLVLKRRSSGKQKRYTKLNDIITIRVKDFIGKSGTFKEIFGGYKAGCLKLPKRNVKIDPYFIGIWLGDGEKGNTRICSPDSEIIDYCKEIAEKFDVSCKLRKERDGCPAYRISLTNSIDKKGVGKNEIRNILKEYNILNNKHIPDDYLLNSEDNRLLLLAGLLDTDGSWSGNRFSITLSNEILAKQCKQLATHLGFRVKMYYRESKFNRKTFPCWQITIGGDTWRIPTKIKRKKSTLRSLGRGRLNSTLDIKPTEVGDFAGIEVDKDNIFLLADGTLTHNCQLPPINTEKETTDWCFLDDIWHDTYFKTAYLNEIVRTKDTNYLKILNTIRSGEINKDVSTFLDSKLSDSDRDKTCLFAYRSDVSYLNELRLNEIDKPLFEFKTKYYVKSRGLSEKQRLMYLDLIAKNSPLPPNIKLKEGAFVMIRVNDNESYKYVNGSTGFIKKIYKDYIEIELLSGEFVYLTEHTFEMLDADGSCVATSTNYPINLAWASTIHKSQGMTLDRAYIDLSNLWDCGQAYVALSRLRDSSGLFLKGWVPSSIKVDKKVYDFYTSLEKENNKKSFFEDL